MFSKISNMLGGAWDWGNCNNLHPWQQSTTAPFSENSQPHLLLSAF